MCKLCEFLIKRAFIWNFFWKMLQSHTFFLRDIWIRDKFFSWHMNPSNLYVMIYWMVDLFWVERNDDKNNRPSIFKLKILLIQRIFCYSNFRSIQTLTRQVCSGKKKWTEKKHQNQILLWFLLIKLVQFMLPEYQPIYEKIWIKVEINITTLRFPDGDMRLEFSVWPS